MYCSILRACLALACLFVSGGALAQGEVAATVNRDTITVAEWQMRLQNLRAQDFLASTNPLRFKTESAGQIAIESLIASRLALQYAEKVGLLPTDAEIEAEMPRVKQQPAVAQALERKRITEEFLRYEVRVQRALYNIATVNESVSPSEVKAFYDRNPALFGTPEQWQLAVIRVSNAQAAEKAQAEIKQGTPFASVAVKYTEDENTRQRGGDLGFISVNDPGLPGYVREAVQKLKVGEVTPTLQSAGTGGRTTFLIVRLLAKREANIPPLEQVQEQARRMALFEKVGGMAGADRKLEEFRKTAVISVSLPGYQDLYRKP
jgi:foldase protein PrsA